MALPECWLEMEEAVGIRQAMIAAQVSLNEEGDIRIKQKELQQLLTDSKLKLESFEGIFGELEDDMEDTELATFHELWVVEVNTAAQEAEKEITRICQTNEFQTADVDVVGGYVTSKVAVNKQKRKISEAADDIEAELSAAQTDELASLEVALEMKFQTVKKAKRARYLTARTNSLLSPKKSSKSSDQGSPGFVSNDCKQEENGQDTQGSTLAANSSELTLATDSSQDNNSTMAETTTSVNSTVLVSQVVNGMMQDAEVLVKLFYTPHGISTLPALYSSGPLKIYEARVGAEGKEYILVARGEAATHAAFVLQDFGQKVVKLRHVKHTVYRNQDQLEVLENMEVDACDDSEIPRSLTQQSLKRCTLQQLLDNKSNDKQKISLQTCRVLVDSQSKLDKNGHPFRSTKLYDAAGSVTMVMVWGGLAAIDENWKCDAVLNICAAEVHFSEKRLNLRDFSHVNLLSQTSSFKKPTKLTYLKWD
jgi:hypothetical protein